MIDWSRVEELKNEIGAEDFAEVVALFLEEADEVVADMGRGLPAPKVESALHFLKGSALNLGFSKLAKLCQGGETVAAQGDAGAVDLREVVLAYEQSKSAFLGALGTILAA
jgi:HPt (histidine-containing phosphotransfer) domain-containing protein